MRLRGEPPRRNGAVTDLTNPMWERLVVEPRYRCLIPLTHFAYPGGNLQEKTRTWFSLIDEPLVAWAGFYQNTDQFGPVFAGMTTAANDLVMPYDYRMPVLLNEGEWERWLLGSIKDVITFQFRAPISNESMMILRTGDGWKSGKLPRPMKKSELELL
jgi:putative SOS response-associated peptidase YedK